MYTHNTCESCTYDRHIDIWADNKCLLRRRRYAGIDRDRPWDAWNFHPRRTRFTQKPKLPPPVSFVMSYMLTVTQTMWLLLNNFVTTLPGQEQPTGRKQPVRPSHPKYCPGLLGRACQFGARGTASPAPRPTEMPLQWHNQTHQAFLEGRTALDLRKRFNRLTSQAQDLALSRVTDPGYRHWLEQHRHPRRVVSSSPLPRLELPENSTWKRTEPFPPAELAGKACGRASPVVDGICKQVGPECIDAWTFNWKTLVVPILKPWQVLCSRSKLITEGVPRQDGRRQKPNAIKTFRWMAMVKAIWPPTRPNMRGNSRTQCGRNCSMMMRRPIRWRPAFSPVIIQEFRRWHTSYLAVCSTHGRFQQHPKARKILTFQSQIKPACLQKCCIIRPAHGEVRTWAS